MKFPIVWLVANEVCAYFTTLWQFITRVNRHR